MRRMRIRFPGRRLALTLAAAALPPLAPAFPRVLAAAEGPFAADAPKRPQALAIVGRAADELLLVGNRSGSVSVIRTGDLILLGETAVGGEITDLEPLPTRSGSAGKPPAPAVVAVDHERHALLLLRVAPAPPRGPVPFPTAVETPLVEVAAAFPTCRHPMRTALRGGTLAVSCLWSRRVVLYDLDGPGGLETPRAEVGLPFEAQELLFLDDRTLLAADGFAGGLAVVSAEDGQVLRVRELSAHNLRGLALLPGGTRVAVAHQELHSGMHTSSDDIRWGVFLTNSVSLLPVDDLRSGSPRLERRTRVLDLGNVLTPSGDPAALIAGADGSLAVALSGVGRLAFGAVDARQTSHVRVGRGPSAMVSGSGGRLYVANTRSVFHLGGIPRPAAGDRPSTARSARTADRRRPGRDAVPRCESLAPGVDELRELPHPRAHEPPALGHPRRRETTARRSGCFRSWGCATRSRGRGTGRSGGSKTRWSSRCGPPSAGERWPLRKCGI